MRRRGSRQAKNQGWTTAKVKYFNVSRIKLLLVCRGPLNSLKAKHVRRGVPGTFCNQVPPELKEAIDMRMTWSDLQMSKYRLDWCRKWLSRATELHAAEAADRMLRPEHIRATTRHKRLLLTKEILDSLGYQDVGCLKLLREGAALAGDIEPTKVFKSQILPGSTTLQRLTNAASKRNAMILP